MATLTAQRTVIDAGIRLDADRAPGLRRQIETVFADDQTPVIDVRSVEHMDMAGLSALAWLLVLCRRRDAGAYLLGPLPEPVSRLLDLTTFDRFFQIRLGP